MSGPSGLHQPRFDLRWLFGSPLLTAACVAGLCASVVLARALEALGEAERLRADLEQRAVAMVAESAASRFVGGDRERVYVDAGRGIAVSARVAPVGGGEAALYAMLGGDFDNGVRFHFPILPGAGPGLLARPLSVVGDLEGWPEAWPRPHQAGPAELPQLALDDGELIRESRSSLNLAQDPGVALLYLPVGTDRRDFVLRPGGAAPARFDAPPSGVLVVDGHLWVDRGSRSLQLQLDRNLTIVVRGNVYLGRSIEAVGPGHLILVALDRGGVGFLDRDGNGRFSPGDQPLGATAFGGPVEGAGNVYLGTPGVETAELQLDCGVVAHGGLHLLAERAVVHGPLVLAHGGVAVPGRGGDLVATGRRLPELQRSVVPGFRVVGPSRPGVLAPEQTLYPARPTR